MWLEAYDSFSHSMSFVCVRFGESCGLGDSSDCRFVSHSNYPLRVIASLVQIEMKAFESESDFSGGARCAFSSRLE